jgi:replicative DNA helicase
MALSPQAPLHDPEAEQCGLGSMILEREGIPDLLEVVSAEEFHDPRHARVFEAILALYDRSESIDFVTVGEELDRRGHLAGVGGRAYLIELSRIVPTTAHALAHAGIVRRCAVRRRLREAGGEILRSVEEPHESVEELLDRAEARIFDLATKGAKGGGVSIREVLRDVMARILEERSRGRLVTGLPTHYFELDEITSGLQPGELFVLAARPSMGKTALALGIAENVALREKKGVALFSLEMSAGQVASRMICSLARVDAHRLRQGRLSDGEYARLGEAHAELSEAPLFVEDDPLLSPLALRARSRRLHRKEPLGLIVVDYMQLLHTGARMEYRQQEVSLISRSLKALARELSVPVLALSQLNRSPEDRDDKRPRLADLRESGSIEQDADLVAFLFREDYYKPKGAARPEREEGGGDTRNAAELIIAKQRNGPTGTVRLRFLSTFVRFENPTLSPVEPLSVS